MSKAGTPILEMRVLASFPVDLGLSRPDSQNESKHPINTLRKTRSASAPKVDSLFTFQLDPIPSPYETGGLRRSGSALGARPKSELQLRRLLKNQFEHNKDGHAGIHPPVTDPKGIRQR